MGIFAVTFMHCSRCGSAIRPHILKQPAGFAQPKGSRSACAAGGRGELLSPVSRARLGLGWAPQADAWGYSLSPTAWAGLAAAIIFSKNIRRNSKPLHCARRATPVVACLQHARTVFVRPCAVSLEKSRFRQAN